MAVRFILSILITISLTSWATAKNIKPNERLTAYEVLKIQLEALKNNDKPKMDNGIEQTWLFAHPQNKIITGPLDRFKLMLYDVHYKILLNHKSHKIKLISNSLNKYVFGVTILSSTKELYFYEWHLETGDEKNCKNCWFTSSVSFPFQQGNTI
tara:strand:- start:62 stop:523 length:462 start_codon:yes stop_codon:yes gene_type:complete